MTSEEALATLEGYLQKKGLKTTAQRRLITEVFFDPKFKHDHPSVDDLYRHVRQRDPNVGYATVYRTVRLLVECGLASPRQLGPADKETRYEPESPGEHHDHLVCLDCGYIVEFENDEIEVLQQKVASSYGFTITEHRMVLYGRCQREDCERRPAAARGGSPLPREGGGGGRGSN